MILCKISSVFMFSQKPTIGSQEWIFFCKNNKKNGISYFHLKSRQQAIYSALLVHFWKAPNSLETDQTEDGHLKLPRDWQEINKLSHYCCLPRVWQEAGVGNRASTNPRHHGMRCRPLKFWVKWLSPAVDFPTLAFTKLSGFGEVQVFRWGLSSPHQKL